MQDLKLDWQCVCVGCTLDICSVIGTYVCMYVCVYARCVHGSRCGLRLLV